MPERGNPLSKRTRPGGWLPVALTALAVLHPMQPPCAGADDAISREFTAGVGPLFVGVGSLDAVAREFTVGTGALYSDPQPLDAIAREFTVGTGELYEEPTPNDAIAREFTVGLGERYRVAQTDAIAREFSMRTLEANLVALSVTAPDSAATGVPFQITWSVRNEGDRGVDVAWTDRLFLSPTPELTGGALLLCEVPVEPPLAPDADYQRTLPCVVPPVDEFPPGPYWLILETNANRTVEESSYADNVLAEWELELLPEAVIPAEIWLVH